MLSEIMDRLNLWHYEDADDREERAGLFGNRMEENEGNFLLNIVTYKPRTMDDVQHNLIARERELFFQKN